VGLLEVARDYALREGSFVRKPPLRLLSPHIVGHEALSAALFGKMDAFIAVRYHEILADLGHETVEVAVEDALRFTKPTVYTPLAMSERHLQSDGLRQHQFYALREDDALDLALFWNLRAREPNVMPLTLELLRHADMLEELRARIATDEYANSSRRVFVGTLGGDRLTAILDRFKLVAHPDLNYLYPTAREDYEPSDCSSKTYSIVATSVISAEGGRLAIEALSPDIVRADWKDGLRFTNDVTLQSLDDNQLPADVVPADAMLQPQAWQTPWRVGPAGFAFVFPSLARTGFDFEPPDARAVMRAFFSDAGFACGVSEQGMLFEQLLRRLDGRVASGVVTHTALRAPIKTLDGRGTIQACTLYSMLRQNGLTKCASLSVINLLETSGVLAQGMIQHCPLCNQRPWFSLASLAPRLICEYCRGAFDARLVGDKRLEPALRILAPLDLPANREGLLAVLAVVNFLRNGFSLERFTIGAGVKVHGLGVDCEYDLVVLARGISGALHVLFCESSARLPFDDKDFNRFQRILPYFPKAYFAFATLRDVVPEAELALIRSFARTNGSVGKPQHRVFVLTSMELTPRGDNYMAEHSVGSMLSYFVEKRAASLLAT
jgi:hypothetical protein